MREGLVIITVILVFLGLTAIRYRAQIKTIIRFWRQVRAMKKELHDRSRPYGNIENNSGLELVNCAKCGKWVSRSETRRFGDGHICMTGCGVHTAG